MTYDVDYFIRRLRRIPEHRWVEDRILTPDGRSCALGLCGARVDEDRGLLRHSKASLALNDLIIENLGIDVCSINDKRAGDFQQPTPRARILAALQAIKAKEAA